MQVIDWAAYGSLVELQTVTFFELIGYIALRQATTMFFKN